MIPAFFTVFAEADCKLFLKIVEQIISRDELVAYKASKQFR